MAPLILLLPLLAVASEPSPAPGPGAAVRALVRFTPPPGWKKEEYANEGGTDAVLAFQNGLDRIALRVFGAAGSAYKTPQDFMKSPAASTMGRAPEPDGQAVVAGRVLQAYRRGYPLMAGDPHGAPAPPAALARERFVVLPLSGGRFLVAAHAFESPVPDLERRGEKAFEVFLRTLKPVKKRG